VTEPYLVVCAALLLGSVLARALPADRRSFDDDHEDGWDLTPRELAFLRNGPYAVVLTVLAELHGNGAVDLGRGDRVHRLDPPRDCDDRLAIAVYSGLNWSRRPRLLALLPRVRRACAPLRWDLRERALLPPVRRRLFAAALQAYAVGLAVATAIEGSAHGSTVVGAVAVSGVAALAALGPRRTVAGFRELAQHRRALHGVAEAGDDEAAYLADLVAAYGIGAVQVLCDGYIPSGAFAPALPSYEPRPVLEPVAAATVEPWPRWSVPAGSPLRRPTPVPVAA
jgi:uncharacterized protein (TIGR04222 family)